MEDGQKHRRNIMLSFATENNIIAFLGPSCQSILKLKAFMAFFKFQKLNCYLQTQIHLLFEIKIYKMSRCC